MVGDASETTLWQRDVAGRGGDGVVGETEEAKDGCSKKFAVTVAKGQSVRFGAWKE